MWLTSLISCGLLRLWSSFPPTWWETGKLIQPWGKRINIYCYPCHVKESLLDCFLKLIGIRKNAFIKLKVVYPIPNSVLIYSLQFHIQKHTCNWHHFLNEASSFSLVEQTQVYEQAYIWKLCDIGYESSILILQLGFCPPDLYVSNCSLVGCLSILFS